MTYIKKQMGGPMEVNPKAPRTVQANRAVQATRVAPTANRSTIAIAPEDNVIPGNEMTREEFQQSGLGPTGGAAPVRYDVGRYNRHVQQTGGLRNGRPQFEATGAYRSAENHANIRTEINRMNPKLKGGYYINGRLIH